MQKAALVRKDIIELLPNINRKGHKALLKVEVGGVCATDRKVFARPPATMQLPRVLGHECCGTLLADLGHLRKGMRVVLWPAIACGSCFFCHSERPHLCEAIQLFGFHLDGGFTHTLSVPGHLWQKVIALPLFPALSCRTAVFAEPLGCVLHGLAKERRVPNRVLILGAGLMGRLAARAANCRWPACEVMLCDNNPQRRSGLPGPPRSVLAGPVPADLIFIACSNEGAVRGALEVLEPGGTIILFSGLADHANEVVVDHNQLHRKEQTLIGSYGCTPKDMATAITLLAQGQVAVDDLVTNTIGLSGLGAELTRTPDHTDYKTIIVSE